jgi:hypothetical protein
MGIFREKVRTGERVVAILRSQDGSKKVIDNGTWWARFKQAIKNALRR